MRTTANYMPGSDPRHRHDSRHGYLSSSTTQMTETGDYSPLQAASESEVGAWSGDLGAEGFECSFHTTPSASEVVVLLVLGPPLDAVLLGLASLPRLVVLLGPGHDADPPVEHGVWGVAGWFFQPVVVGDATVDGVGFEDALGAAVDVGAEGLVDGTDFGLGVIDDHLLPGLHPGVTVGALFGFDHHGLLPGDLNVEASEFRVPVGDALLEHGDAFAVIEPFTWPGGELADHTTMPDLLDPLAWSVDVVALHPSLVAA